MPRLTDLIALEMSPFIDRQLDPHTQQVKLYGRFAVMDDYSTNNTMLVCDRCRATIMVVTKEDRERANDDIHELMRGMMEEAKDHRCSREVIVKDPQGREVYRQKMPTVAEMEQQQKRNNQRVIRFMKGGKRNDRR